MNEALKAIFEGQDFSDDFKQKITTIFEAAVEEQATQIEEETQAKYEQLAEEYREYVVEELEAKTEEYLESEVMPMVEKYLDYSVQEFMTENQLAVENGTKVQLAEQFLSGMSGIAESFNVQVPEGQNDYITEMEQKLEAMQDRFDRVLDENAQLQESLKIDTMADIVDSKVSDLTESQKEKFFNVAKRIKFQDEEQYTKAIDDLYESYFPTESGSMHRLEEQQATKQLNEQKSTPKFTSWEDELFAKI